MHQNLKSGKWGNRDLRGFFSHTKYQGEEGSQQFYCRQMDMRDMLTTNTFVDSLGTTADIVIERRKRVLPLLMISVICSAPSVTDNPTGAARMALRLFLTH